MTPRLDLTGKKFGKLTVVKFKGTNKNSKSTWECKCDCGITKILVGSHLISGNSTTCGCGKIGSPPKHGMSNTLTFMSWRAMINRCKYSAIPLYKKYYIDKGITVCERWQVFLNFLEDMGERPDNRTLERIDNSKGYYKENCKWATRYEQVRNSGNRTIININEVRI